MNEKVIDALKEYTAYLVIVSIAYLFFTKLPYFQQMLEPTSTGVVVIFLKAVVFLYLPYALIRNHLWWEKYRNNRSKPEIVLAYVFSSLPKLFRVLRTPPKDVLFMRPKMSEEVKVAILALVVKFFYFPLMISFFVGNYEIAVNQWNLKPNDYLSITGFINWGYYFIYNFILVIDTIIFVCGYALESKWLKNEIKSVDPYLSGWVFTLICYPPFVTGMNSFLQYTPAQITSFSFTVLFNFKLITLVCYAVYLWASIALWMKSSNLTNRGIVGHGPYRYIRHPAYIAKNLAWWFERLPYLTTWAGFFSLLVWNGIYLMRALTEERHLLADPDYQAYVKKVRWRFIPGVI